MKKSFMIMFLLFSIICFNTSSQESSINKNMIISGFDGDEALTEETEIFIIFPGYPEDQYLVPAYKGETSKLFLDRINNPNYISNYLKKTKVISNSIDENQTETKIENNKNQEDLPELGLTSKIIILFLVCACAISIIIFLIWGKIRQ